MNYKTLEYGKGQFRTYYMNERKITSKRFYQLWKLCHHNRNKV